MDHAIRRIAFFLVATALSGGVAVAASPDTASHECPFMKGAGMHAGACGEGKECPAGLAGMGPHHGGGSPMFNMDELNLTAEQRSAMQQIFERARTRGIALAERGSAIRSEFMDVSPDDPAYASVVEQAASSAAAAAADGARLMGEIRQEVHDVLTDEQREQLRNRASERRQQWEDWRKRHQPAQ
jgi:Spy/CpxP family protein refolding chaperone